MTFYCYYLLKVKQPECCIDWQLKLIPEKIRAKKV
jgi:hypothetical protein